MSQESYLFMTQEYGVQTQPSVSWLKLVPGPKFPRCCKFIHGKIRVEILHDLIENVFLGVTFLPWKIFVVFFCLNFFFPLDFI